MKRRTPGHTHIPAPDFFRGPASPIREYFAFLVAFLNLKCGILLKHALIALTMAALAGKLLAVPSGPAVGQPVPDFHLQDQNSAPRTLRSVLGPKGALLVFYRSADW